MAAAKILLVEDEFLIRLTLSEALSDEGFDVLQASSGDEAMTLVADPAGLSLLLTDVELPGALNGNALARSLR